MKPLLCSQQHANSPNNRFCTTCGENLVSKKIHSGLILGDRYRVVRQLGQGGFGRTYLAADLSRFSELCVLKEFAPHFQGTYASRKAQQLFEREAKVLHRLQHPQIPQFRELFQVQQQGKDSLFLVQDFVVGQTYHTLLMALKSQGKRFSEADVTELLLKILPVLEYIHSEGVIHRDIAPDNLMLRSSDGEPVLIDFGGVKQVAMSVAREFQGTIFDTNKIPATRVGKIGYAPPEQLQQGMASPNSDLYALAATALVLLTGKEPTQLIEPQSLNWNWQQEVELSPRLEGILEHMLQRKPSARFASATEVLQALTSQSVASQQAPPETEAPDAVETDDLVTSHHRFSGWLWQIPLTLLVIVTAGSFGWWGGNVWIQSKKIPSSPDQEVLFEKDYSAITFLLDDTNEPPPPLKFSPEEQQRRENLEKRLDNLGINREFYSSLVYEAFWKRYPQQDGRKPSNSSKDTELRADRDAIAADLLDKIEKLNLSKKAMKRLGTYKTADLTKWRNEANRLHLSSSALYDLADAKFFKQFPEQPREPLTNKSIGQVWEAIVGDTITKLQSQTAVEKIVFDQGTVSQQKDGTLQPGEGKAFIAKLSKAQSMQVELQANSSALFSIYCPPGVKPIIEDSKERSWSGNIKESGFYEFIVVSEAAEPIEYQLNITVED
ncbi:MAG: serine/threonine protein kinase [Symploca sp. SIO2G7]|nr:serine/threonine protein kinase [Symploca sp. SIO2G7]